MQNISKFLSENQDAKYANFHKALIFTDHPILGVRLPLLRKFAKEISPEQISLSKNSSHEEILLYGFSAAANSNTESKQLEFLQNVLPFIDNWATCDCITPTFKKLTGEKSYSFFTNLLLDSREFYVRVGLIGLMRFFIKSDKINEILPKLSKLPILSEKENSQKQKENSQKQPDIKAIKNKKFGKNDSETKTNFPTENYYVKMAIAWFAAELAVTNFSLAKAFIASNQDKFIRNKSISKARESFRLTSNQKQELLSLKIK